MVRATGSALRTLSFPSGVRQAGIPLLVAGFLLAVCLVGAKRKWGSREQRVVRKFLRMVGKRYPHISISPSTGLLELAERTGDPRVRRFADIRYGALYRDRKLSERELSLLEDITRAFAASREIVRDIERTSGTSH